MGKQETRTLHRQWVRANRLLREIVALGQINPILAYGIIRTAENFVDSEMVLRMQQVAKDKAKAAEEPKEEAKQWKP